MHTPLVLLGAAIALFSTLILTERLAAPEDATRRQRPASRLVDPYSAVALSPVSLTPMRGLPPLPPFRDFLRDDLVVDTFPPDMDSIERLMRHAALLGDRKTAWLSIDEPVRLLTMGHAAGLIPRGPLMPLPEHLPLLTERVHGAALVAFDNRSGGWTLILPTRQPYDTLQTIAAATGVTLGNVLSDDTDRTRRILELTINPNAAQAHDLPFTGTLWIITHEGLDALFVTNVLYEGRRFLSGLARGQHAFPIEDLLNRRLLEEPLAFAPDWKTDGIVESRFVLLAPAAAANTTANSEALRMGEWLLGVQEWETLKGSATLAVDGALDWQLTATSANGAISRAAMVALLGGGDARPLLAHLPTGARTAVAVHLASLTDTYDAWRDHLVTMGFPDGAEGVARAERDLAMSLGFWIRESLLPLLGDRLAMGVYGDGEDETWLVVADARDPRSVERMIAQASERLDGAAPFTTPGGVTMVAGTGDIRPRAWRVVGNRVVVACGNMAESLVGGTHPVAIAEAFHGLDHTAGSKPTPLAIYSGSLLAPFDLPLVGAFCVEDGAMVLRGSILRGSPPSTVSTTAAIR